MNLVNLVEDINYQDKYDYEKRVDLFNKYGISAATTFFVPIWGLSQFIQNICHMGRGGYCEFGHGQRILNSSLKETSQQLPDKNKVDTRRIVLKGNIIEIWIGVPNIESHPLIGTRRQIIRFSPSGSLKLNNYGFLNMVYIPRNLYEKIDEWLIDFGYEKWM